MLLDRFHNYKHCAEYCDDLYNGELISRSQFSEIVHKKHALFGKNIYDFDLDIQTNNWYIIRDRYYDLEEYASKNVRKHIRKSLSIYCYKRVDKDEMIRNGYQVFCNGAERFDKNVGPYWSKNEFEKWVMSFYKVGGEFFAGYDIESGKMVMWEALYIKGDMVVEFMERLSSEFTKHNPTYGLNHEITKHYIMERGYKYINAGSMTLDDHSNVQSFLVEKFHFRRAYCRVQLFLPFYLKVLLLFLKPFYKYFKRRFPSLSVTKLLTLYLLADIK